MPAGKRNRDWSGTTEPLPTSDGDRSHRGKGRQLDDGMDGRPVAATYSYHNGRGKQSHGDVSRKGWDGPTKIDPTLIPPWEGPDTFTSNPFPPPDKPTRNGFESNRDADADTFAREPLPLSDGFAWHPSKPPVELT